MPGVPCEPGEPAVIRVPGAPLCLVSLSIYIYRWSPNTWNRRSSLKHDDQHIFTFSKVLGPRQVGLIKINKGLAMFDCKFGFSTPNCVHYQVEMPRGQE